MIDQINNNCNKIGYARVSTISQNLDGQIDSLEKAGCIKIFTDKFTGTKMSRDGWNDLNQFLRPGDSIVVTELSRVTRSLYDLMATARELEQKKINLVSLKESIDTKTAIGRFFFAIVGGLSEMEVDLKKERAAIGRAASKARGGTGGRPRLDKEKIEAAKIVYKNSNKPVREICKSFGVSRRAFYYALEVDNKEENPWRSQRKRQKSKGML